MKSLEFIFLVVFFLLGMLMLNTVKNVCGCKVVEGFLESQGDIGSIRDSVLPEGSLTDEQEAMIERLEYCNIFLNSESGCDTGFIENEQFPTSGCLPESLLDCEDGIYDAIQTPDGQEECGNISSLQDFQNTIYQIGKISSSSCDGGSASPVPSPPASPTPPPPVDCAGTWSTYGACVADEEGSCNGTQTRQYTVTTSAEYGGSDCENNGGDTESQACTITPPEGYCDCNGQQLDVCNVCGGNGIPEGDCDCNGHQLDECNVCGGPGNPCLNGGTCSLNADGSGALCDCPLGYGGTDCNTCVDGYQINNNVDGTVTCVQTLDCNSEWFTYLSENVDNSNPCNSDNIQQFKQDNQCFPNNDNLPGCPGGFQINNPSGLTWSVLSDNLSSITINEQQTCSSR